MGVGSGSSYEAYLGKTLQIPGALKPIAFPFDDVSAVPGDETVAFQNLALGDGVRLDASVADLATSKARIDKGAPLKIAAALYAEPNVITTDKADPEWDAKVRDTILQLKGGGTLATISRKWFGEDIPPTRADVIVSTPSGPVDSAVAAESTFDAASGADVHPAPRTAPRRFRA